MICIRTSYDTENFPAFDDAVFAAAGRVSDFSGAGFGQRDHGWNCASEIEAHKIKTGLKKIGLSVTAAPIADKGDA